LVINYKKEDSHTLDKLEEMETAFYRSVIVSFFEILALGGNYKGIIELAEM